MENLKYVLVVLPSIIMIILGVSIKYFKAYWLISGYNTMSKEKKKNVDVEKLGVMMGNFCFAMAFYMFVIILFLVLEIPVVSIIAVVMLVATIIFLLIKSQKYDGNAIDENGRMKTGTKIVIGVIIAFLLTVLTLVGLLLAQSNKPTNFTVTQDSLAIDGMYGETVKGADISSVTISDSLPEITLRTNGSALGKRLKGFFNVTGLGNVKLFLNTETKRYIFIKTGTRTIILNSEDLASTQILYEKIKTLTNGE
jgi:hypothetical protein